MTTPENALELEIEGHGTPEQVWDAIATGPGISSWIHPATVEEREGGTFTFDMGDGPRSGTVTAWEPPRHFGEADENQLLLGAVGRVDGVGCGRREGDGSSARARRLRHLVARRRSRSGRSCVPQSSGCGRDPADPGEQLLPWCSLLAMLS